GNRRGEEQHLRGVCFGTGAVRGGGAASRAAGEDGERAGFDPRYGVGDEPRRERRNHAAATGRRLSKGGQAFVSGERRASAFPGTCPSRRLAGSRSAARVLKDGY